MLFDEKFVESIKDDPIKGVIDVCRIAFGNLKDDQNEWYASDYETLSEAYALTAGLIEAGLLTTDQAEPEITGELSSDCSNIVQYLREIERFFSSEASKLRLQYLKSHFRTSLGAGFCYEFSQGDLERVQTLIDQLRDQISASAHFEPEHQQRLLKRLEKLQSEIHKRVSDLDRFWGLIGDAGVVLGKFGNDAKPLVDRIKEIAEIVWQTQSRAEELPSGTPFPLLARKNNRSEGGA